MLGSLGVFGVVCVLIPACATGWVLYREMGDFSIFSPTVEIYICNPEVY